MKRLWPLALLAAGCAPRVVQKDAPPERWIPVERSVARLDYGAGDGAVAGDDRVITLVRAADSAKKRKAPPDLSVPSRVEVGEIFRIEIRVPRADPLDIRSYRIRCGRPGLRLPDGDRVVVKGRGPAFRRAVADSAGPASFDLEELSD